MVFILQTSTDEA